MLSSESYKRGVVLSTFFNFLAKSLGFVQSLAIAFYFGARLETDIYLYFYGVALLFAGFLNGMDQTVLIPEAIRLKTQESVRESLTFLNSFLYLYLLIILILLATFFFFPTTIAAAISKYDTATLDQNLYLVLGAASLTMLVVLTTYLSNVLLAFRFFSIPVVIAIVNSVISLTFLVVLNDSLGTLSIILGLLIGYTLNIIAVLLLMRWKLKWHFAGSRASFGRLSFRNITYVQLGNFSTLLCSYVPFYLLTGYAAGIITNINYAMRTADIPNQIIVAQISAIIGIKFSEQVAAKDFKGFAGSFTFYSQIALSILVPMSIFLAMNSNDFIGVLYGRGSFTGKSIDETALAFGILILNVPLYAINSIVARVFIATQRLDISFLYQIGMNAGYILLIYLFMHFAGPMGYPFATVSIYSISFLLVHFFIRKVSDELEFGRVLMHMMKTVLICVAAGSAVSLLTGQLPVPVLVRLMLSGLLFVTLFVAIAYPLNLLPGLDLKLLLKRSSYKL